MIELTAQSVVDYARANGIRLCRRCTPGDYPDLCAIWALTYSLIPFNKSNRYEKLNFISNYEFLSKHFNIDIENVFMIEAGFEGWDDVDPDNPYYKMGQEIYRLSRKA